MKKIFPCCLGLVLFYTVLFSVSFSSLGQSLLHAASFTASGTVAETSSMTVTVQNGTSLTGTSPTATTFNFAQYLKVDYSANRSGWQAVLIYTDNSAATANPKYTGFGDGAGLVKTTQTDVNAPMHWVVFPSVQSGGYNFDPIDPSNEFFVVDKKRPDGSAFPAGFASFIFDIRQAFATLADAPIIGRNTNSGTVYVYLCTNLAGQSAGIYKSNTLNIELDTLTNGSITTVHHKQTFTATVTL